MVGSGFCLAKEIRMLGCEFTKLFKIIALYKLAAKLDYVRMDGMVEFLELEMVWFDTKCNLTNDFFC